MRSLIFACAVLLSLPALADDAVKCETGPVVKTFGGTSWQVFSCNEDRHLMFVPIPGNPAGQVIFMLFWETDHWMVTDDWVTVDTSSDRQAASAAEQEIRALSEAQITALTTETRSHKN